MSEQKEFKYIGTRSIRPDGVDKVTGRAKYGADFFLPGMIHGKILRSPLAHGRIKSIDVSQALAVPGVLSAVTAEDMPDVRVGTEPAGEGEVDFYDISCNVLARKKCFTTGML
ncbi:MAG: hypothetical protein JKY67_15465 [Pseudomonadales bacterium]|nr:hypothetical protein [Pseudomonadales bacterium]